MSSARQRIALVAPFFGRENQGRKERFAFSLATHLSLEGAEVDVVTTTAREKAPDENRYRSGVDNTEPFPVHRFRVSPPDRSAFVEAVLLSQRAELHDDSQLSALIDERVRSPDLIAHIRAVADRYDAFVFVDAVSPTTVHGIAAVAEHALLFPLLDDVPEARLSAVAQAVASARLLLCTTEAEAALVAERFGGAMRTRIQIVGLAVDAVPLSDVPAESTRRAVEHGSYVLVAHDGGADESTRFGLHAVALGDQDEYQRAALFANARLVLVAADHLGFAPEVIEAWEYGKAVVVSPSAPAAVALVREVGAGIVASKAGNWAQTIAGIDSDRAAEMGARGRAYVDRSGGWRRIALRTSEAIDAIAALDDGRSREALLAQISYLYPLVQRQRRVIEAMRVSRFWELRNRWFAAKRRLGVGPAADPVPISSVDDRAAALAAIGDPYQLFRDRHRLREEDVARIRATAPFLPRRVNFGISIDVRGRTNATGFAAVAATLRNQLWTNWRAQFLIDETVPSDSVAELAAMSALDSRFHVGSSREWRDADFVGPVDVGDKLEPHALFEIALALQDPTIDVVYSDEDRLDDQGVPSDPWFKSDWAPESALTRDIVGRCCFFRRALVEQIDNLKEVFDRAIWYDGLLRISERTDAIAHIPQVLYHRDKRNVLRPQELAVATELAMRRRAEETIVRVKSAGLDVEFLVPGDERVCVVIPTRDHADLLGACLESLFTVTAYPSFDVLVVDNGSRDADTHLLFQQWRERHPDRFSVLTDPAPFNYARLNNAAVQATEAPFVVLLNNDTTVLEPTWMERMLGHARRPQIGAVGAMLLYPDSTVQHGGVITGVLDLAGHAFRHCSGATLANHGALQLDTNYSAVTGACLMVARAKYLELGGLDETFEVSYNDVDFCLRLRQAGYRNVYVPAARLFHFESKTRGADDTPWKVRRAQAEFAEMMRRWPEYSLRDPYYNPNFTTVAEDFSLRL